MYLAFIKLGLMTLAAAVTWMRAAKSTSPRMTGCSSIASAWPTAQKRDAEPIDRYIVWEDATVGLMAIAARLGVAIGRP